MFTILKFGGSSVATADGMRNVANIVTKRAQHEQIILVVSALRGVTDQLIESVYLAEQEHDRYKELYSNILYRHRQLIESLFEPERVKEIREQLEKLFRNLYKLLYSVKCLHDNNLNIIDLITSFGEQLSATVFAAYLNTLTPACFVDARHFILTDNNFTNAEVIYNKSKQLTQDFFEKFYQSKSESIIPVVTGFIGKTLDEHTTTIGRDGSNYTAAFLSSALNAKQLEIWSDVDGVFSADPKLIRNGIVIPNLDYIEAEELSRLHVKIIRHAVTAELKTGNIPLVVKNTFNPDAPGTQISLHTTLHVIKNISVEHSFILFTLSTQVLHINSAHIMERLLREFNFANINFSFVTQAFSTNDVCFLISDSKLKQVQDIINIEFLYEFENKFLSQKKSANQSVVSLVGNGIRQTPSLLGRVLISLDEHHIRLNGMIHGTPDCNISLIINAHQSQNALNVIHQTVFKAKEKEIST